MGSCSVRPIQCSYVDGYGYYPFYQTDIHFFISPYLFTFLSLTSPSPQLSFFSSFHPYLSILIHLSHCHNIRQV